MWLAKLKMKNNKIPQMERRKKRLGNVNRKKRFCNQTKQGTAHVLSLNLQWKNFHPCENFPANLLV